ncbi:MAG: glycosyltransferase [Olegusella sp.]|nr:glycosyltransferase [Olegusella sp.]
MSCEIPLVSIITPFKNTDDKLFAACAESVRLQRYENLEWIIVDDGSDEKHRAVLSDYFTKESRIRIVRAGGKGVSAARNLGLDTACGRYVTFLDSDDELSPIALEDTICYLLQSGADILIGKIQYHKWGQTKEDFARTDHTVLLRSNELERFCRFLVSTKPLRGLAGAYLDVSPSPIAPRYYKRDLLDDLRFNTRMTNAEDSLFGAIAAHRASSIMLVDGDLYRYNLNPYSATYSRNAEDIQRLAKSLAIYCAVGKEQKWSSSDLGVKCCAGIANIAAIYSDTNGILRTSGLIKRMLSNKDALELDSVDMSQYDFTRNQRILYYVLLHEKTFLCAVLLKIRRWLRRR